MPIIRDIKNDIKEAKKIRLPWWVLLCLAIGSLPIYWFFYHFGRLDLALPTLNCMLVLGFLIALKRRLWPHTWFWGILICLAALHVPLVLFVPWTTRWVPALAIAAIDSADLIVMLAMLAVVGKLMGEQKTTERRARSH